VELVVGGRWWGAGGSREGGFKGHSPFLARPL